MMARSVNQTEKCDSRGRVLRRQETIKSEGVLSVGAPSMPGKGTLAAFPMAEFLEVCSKVRIVTKDGGLQPLTMWHSQRYVIEQIANGLSEGVCEFVILKSRQQGITTILALVDLVYMMLYNGLCAAFVIHEDKAMARFRMTIKQYLQSLPAAYRKTPKPENRAMLVLGESIMMYLVAGVKERSQGGMGRSGAINFCHFSEEAFYGTPDDLKQFSSSMSSKFEHRLYIHESTANGFNHFADLCDEAKKNPGMRFIFSPWHFNETYRIERNDPLFAYYMPGADAAPLSRLERHRVSEASKHYSAKIEPEQLAWYRWHLQEKKSGDQNIMDQEYPWVPDDAFIASGAKYFSNKVLTDAMRRARSISYTGMKYDLGDTWREIDVRPAIATNCDLRIWEEPVGHGKYIIACDPAFGSSDLADRTVITVWRCFADRVSQVAEYASNQIATYACAWVLAHLGGYYRDVLTVLEISGPGQTVQDELDRVRRDMALEKTELNRVLQCMRTFIYRRADSMGAAGAWNVRMSFDLKWQILSALKDSFEIHEALVNSVPLLEEMKHIVIKDGKLDVAPHRKDDRVIGAAYAVWAWKKSVRSQMVAAGRTYEREKDPQTAQPQPIELAVVNYMKGLSIKAAGLERR